MSKRIVKLDVIRIIALFACIAVHFLLNCGFYNEIVEGKRMLFMCMYRAIFILCVPMFLTLTGYLKNREKISKNYFKKLYKILTIYLICSIIYAIFTKFYLKEEMNFSIFLQNLLSYKGTDYAWYIEMYIGLFLIIPFLNLIFNNLKTEKECQMLLIILFIMIGLNGILNIYRFDNIEWWMQPSSNLKYNKIVPDYWITIYPIFYYFLGAYLSKFKLKIKKSENVLMIILIVLLFGIFDYYRSFNSKYIWGPWNYYNSGIVMILTVLVFNLLLNINIKESKITNEILKYMSNACLGAYLISCMFDKIYYKKLNLLIPNVKDRFVFAPILVVLSFISSMILSILINIIYNYIEKIIKYIRNRKNGLLEERRTEK